MLKIALLLAPLLVFASPAHARPRVTVTDAVPFSERELDDAISIRSGDVDVRVHVSRDDAGRLVIDVGGQRQTLAVLPDDAPSAARTVALIVVTLIDGPPGHSSHATPDAELPAGLVRAANASSPPAIESPLHFRFMPTVLRDDAGNVGKLATASISYDLSSISRLVATAGIGSFDDGLAGNGVVPLRLGVELLNHFVGVETGGIAIPFVSACGPTPTPAVATGAYGVLRFYFPIGGHTRAVVEGGGYYLPGSEGYQMCNGPLEYQQYAGWAGAGLEWPL